MRIFSLLFLLTMIFNFNTARAEDLPGGATLTCATAETTFAYDENNQKAWIGFWIDQNEMGWRELSEVRFEPGENKLEVYTTLVTEGIGNIYSRHAITFGEKKITMKLSKKDEIEQEFEELKGKNNNFECTKYVEFLTCIDPKDEEEFSILLDKKFNGIPKEDGSYKKGVLLSLQDVNKKPFEFIGDFNVENGKLITAEVNNINSREFWKKTLPYPENTDEVVNPMVSNTATTSFSMGFIYDKHQPQKITSLRFAIEMHGEYDFLGRGKYKPLDSESQQPQVTIYPCTPYVAPKLEPGSKEKKGGEK